MGYFSFALLIAYNKTYDNLDKILERKIILKLGGKKLENGFSQNLREIKKKGRRLWECGVHKIIMFM